ncbi:Prolactin-7B1 [Apodemus speciosus]|uniref:Prolactin-7B1 n=1 Tax=Apodemus speciosus TaxID=105296 RepID=A0ABQ0FFM2_APOSI
MFTWSFVYILELTRALQILLLSNLLLLENAVSVPTSGRGLGVSEMLTEDLFDDAIILSQHINGLAIETRRIFLSSNFSSDMFIAFTLQFNRHDEFVVNGLNSCHTLSLKTPKTEKEAKRISLPDFVKMIVSILHAWDNPLNHMETELKNMPGAPNAILARVKDIEVKNKILLDRIMKIAKKSTFLLLVVSKLLLWEKTASISASHTEEEGCTEHFVEEAFTNANLLAKNILKLTEQMHQEFNAQLIKQNQLILRARTYCHSTITTLQKLDLNT